ncbi:MAG: transposase [Bacteroidota bacterium]
MPHLSTAERAVLALWSFAATITEHIGQTTCAAFLAEALGEPENTLRQRLREFYRPAALKRGTHRRELDVRLSFGPLLRWALALLRPPELVLALDPTLCRDRLAVLTVAVVAHGSAIPVAWVVVGANEPGAWMPHWRPMLDRLHAVVPERTRVIVAADRGLQSTDLFDEIRALGWHPMIRLVRLGSWRERGRSTWTKLSVLPLRPGEHYVARGHLFSTKPHACTLVAVWRIGFDAPWLLMTDLSPARCVRAFYGLRCWIERGFRDAKAGGLRCERLRITDPARMERVWLAVAVSLLWTHAVGATPEASERLVEGVRRRLGAHRRGWVRLLGALARGVWLPLPRRVRSSTGRIPTLAEVARPPT